MVAQGQELRGQDNEANKLKRFDKQEVGTVFHRFKDNIIQPIPVTRLK